MASLFRNRTLSNAFPHRNVVIESVGVRSKNDDIIFRCSLDFGYSGKLVRGINIKAVGNTFKSITKDLREYEESLSEIVEILQALKVWASDVRSSNGVLTGTEDIFNRVLCEEHPLMFHGVRNNKGISFKIFGEGLHDMEIVMDYKQAAAFRAFNIKIEAIISAFTSHQQDIKNTSLATILQGAA